jgi:para-aminobenzoate synthetase
LPTLIIDNYDSFTFNLVHAVAMVTGEMPLVIHNDQMTWDEIGALEFDSIIISPGPGRPDRERDFGISSAAIRNAAAPVLGVCLGHQGIACAFGGRVSQTAPVHGRSSDIFHHGDDLFRGIPERFSAVRYHSLMVEEPLPPELRKIAWTVDGSLMALRHITRPLWGVQFHPESISTEYGIDLIRNFLAHRLPMHRARKPAGVYSPAAAAVTLKTAIRRMPLRHAPEALFRALFSDERHAFWLDSALVTERSRFSYMGASDDVYTSGKESVFDHLDEALRNVAIEGPQVPFPFTGGYVGYLGYELKAECGSPNRHQSAMPDSMFLRVDRFLAIDHQEADLYAVCCGEGADKWLDDIERRIATISPQGPVPASNASKSIAQFAVSRPEYLDRIRDCLSLIAAGESYELCLTNKVRLDSNIPALTYYETLRRTNPAPYAAFLSFGDIQVASSSPECFLRIDRERRVESRPIKGTVRRGCDEEEDARLRELLATDVRFRAENLMIVDLVRHDLARVCEVGSVQAPRLMEVETYPTVHQLVSTITGRLTQRTTPVECVRALFPGGSMTGAPKLRSMELLDRLEPEARGIYSGAIGYLGFNGTADLSIVIRTAVFHEGRVSLGVGGAIVAQSDPAAEWDEMQLKAQALLRAF